MERYQKISLFISYFTCLICTPVNQLIKSIRRSLSRTLHWKNVNLFTVGLNKQCKLGNYEETIIVKTNKYVSSWAQKIYILSIKHSLPCYFNLHALEWIHLFMCLMLHNIMRYFITGEKDEMFIM